MAVELGAGPGASAIEERSAPRPLFVGIPSSGNTPIFTYAAAGDGQRFLVAASRSSEQPPITVVLNWQLALRKRVFYAGRPRVGEGGMGEATGRPTLGRRGQGAGEASARGALTPNIAGPAEARGGAGAGVARGVELRGVRDAGA